MRWPGWILIVIFVAWLAGSAQAQVERDAAAIADGYLAAMQRKGYPFLSNQELSRRREVIADFTLKHLQQPLDDTTRAAILEGIGRCIDRLYTSPAGQINYGNGFGSGGEEWMYLNDRDYFRTFQYYLWIGLTHHPLAPADVQRRDQQRQWMRRYLAHLPYRAGREAPPREGMRPDEVRAEVLGKLEAAFADPMDLLSEPMPEEGFARLRERFTHSSNGIGGDFHGMEVAALTSRFLSHEDPAGRDGSTYSGRLPFHDTVVDIWGNGPSLCFASNADFRGNHGGLCASNVYDVVRCTGMRADPALAPTRAAMEAWLARAGRGDLTLRGSALRAVRGATLARLPVKSWFEAEQYSDDQLRDVVRQGARDSVLIQGLPTMNGIHKADRSEGEFFLIVQTREGRLAVLNLYNYEFHQLMFWCRPRVGGN